MKENQAPKTRKFSSIEVKMNYDDEDSSSEDETGNGLIWEYPEPFKGNTGEDIYDFIEKVETAFDINRVPASSRVVLLKKLVKGYAESSFSDRQSYEDNVERLKFKFGNPYTIWRKKLNDFLHESRTSKKIGRLILPLKRNRCFGKCPAFWPLRNVSLPSLNL